METLIGGTIGGAIALLGVFVTGRMEARKTTLVSSTQLVAAVQSEIRKKLIQSVENLWLSLNASREAYKDPLFLHTILTNDEISDMFLGKTIGKNSIEVTLKEYQGYQLFLAEGPSNKEMSDWCGNIARWTSIMEHL